LRQRIRAAAVAQTQWETPWGEVQAWRSDRGLLGLWFVDQRHHPGSLDIPEQDDDPWFVALRAGLQRYAQTATTFSTDVPLDDHGSAFQSRVWQVLRTLPVGHTVSYAEVAQRMGQPQAVRAVGAAIGRNPWSILVPCHRVVGQGGQLTGYAGGLARKATLLAWEQARA
jgi:methylated-DNA-[protein]-cysteine S-methyltransferase